MNKHLGELLQATKESYVKYVHSPVLNAYERFGLKAQISRISNYVPGLGTNWRHAWSTMGVAFTVGNVAFSTILIGSGYYIVGLAWTLIALILFLFSEATCTWSVRLPLWFLLGPAWIIQDLVLTWAISVCADIADTEADWGPYDAYCPQPT